jgi:hypothetical membrane protein
MSSPRQRPRLDKSLLWSGVVAGPVFVAAFLLEGARRPDYQPVRHPVSSLVLGPQGWVQTVNFSTAGALYLAAAIGLFRDTAQTPSTRVGPAVIGAAAVGLIGAGVFRTDPVSGYPPGTPDALTRYTPRGALHDLFSVPTFLGLPAAALIYARAFHRRNELGWATYSAGTAAVMLAAFGLASAAFSQAPTLVRYGGLLQRVCVTTGFSWLTALALHALRHDPHSPTGRK